MTLDTIPEAALKSIHQRSRVKEYLFLHDPHCCYCGKRFTRARGASLEHLKPRSRKGKTTLANCRLACTRCNELRSSDRLVDFVQRLEAMLLHTKRLILSRPDLATR